MSVKRATPEDPRGIIAESFYIETITEEDARMIFMDWAMMDAPEDAQSVIRAMYKRFAPEFPDHPMTKILLNGQKAAMNKPRTRQRRNGGRNGRRNKRRVTPD